MSLEEAQVFTTRHEDEAIFTSFEIPSMVFVPLVLKGVIELGIMEVLAKGVQLSPSEIVARLSIDNPAAPDMIDRMLRLLASYSIISCTLVKDKGGSPQRLYGLGPRSKYLVGDGAPSLTPLHILLQDKTVLQTWHCLKDAVREGGIDLFSRTHGSHLIDYMSGGRDPRFTDMFNKGMRAQSGIYLPKIAQHYRGFSKAKTVVDVGGGVGETLKIILSKNPHIRAVNYDLPHVIAAAAPIPGIEHVGGDMLQAVPKADVHILKCIIHGGDDEFCVRVLKNCWKALSPTGKVVIMEVVIPEYPGTDELSRSALLMDMNMLRITPCGKDRTRSEYAELARATGFHEPKYALRAYNMWVIELHKKI